MTHIPSKLRAELAGDLFYTRCARREALHDHVCAPDPLRPWKLIEWEHALILSGRQVNERFAIVPLCWSAHRGPAQKKDVAVWIALNRATEEELLELSRHGGVDYFRRRSYLNSIYGQYAPWDESRIAY